MVIRDTDTGARGVCGCAGHNLFFWISTLLFGRANSSISLSGISDISRAVTFNHVPHILFHDESYESNGIHTPSGLYYFLAGNSWHEGRAGAFQLLGGVRLCEDYVGSIAGWR